MKTTPIYILLLIFFLNFNLAFGLGGNIRDYYIWQGLYSVNKIDDSYLHSFDITYNLGQEGYSSPHRLRLNLGVNKVYAQLNYEFGKYINISKEFKALPYLTLGTNIYSIYYGAGIDFKYQIHLNSVKYIDQNKWTEIRTNSWSLVTNINYNFYERLFGNTNAKQWYQKGLGLKIGIEYNLDVPGARNACDIDMN